MELCSVGIMGTQYVRDQTLPETIELLTDDLTSFTIINIYSAIPIGNQLNINLRQSLDNELSFVTFTELYSSTIIDIDATDIQPGDYSLILESFD